MELKLAPASDSDAGSSMAAPPEAPAPAAPWETIARGSLAALGLELRTSDGVLEVLDPQAADDETDPPEPRGWTGALKPKPRHALSPAGPAVLFAVDSPAALFAWLAERAAGADSLPQFVPPGEPLAVHEVASAVFDAYEIEGGAIHLGGCHFAPVAVLRLTTVEAVAEQRLRLQHRYFDRDGNPLADALAAGLGLNDAVPPQDARRRPARGDWRGAIAAAEAELPVLPDGQRALASIVLPRRAYGQLEATIGDESLAIPFDGWARNLPAPPAVCPATGAKTFRLTALEDGRIVAAEQAVVCQATGQKILRSESVVCSVTGKTVAAAACETCPVSGEPTLPEAFGVCPRCGQRVSRVMLTGSACRGCEATQPTDNNDPRIQAVLAAAPRLAKQKRWSIAETGGLLVAETGGLLERVVVAFDPAADRVTHAATRFRLSRQWRPVADLPGWLRAC